MTAASASTSRGRLALCFALGLLVLPVPAPAQSAPAPMPLAAERESLSARLADPSAGAADRWMALRRLARLEALSGDLEAAAEHWYEAAFANPGNPDYPALLESARCHIALGDYLSADRALRAALGSASAPALLLEARYLALAGGAFRAGDGSALAALLDAPEYAGRRPAILYLLWIITGEEAHRARLLREHPASPEGLMIAGRAASSARPFWFLFPGRENAAAGEALPAAPPPSVPAQDQGEEPTLLQTGLFSREENAAAMAGRLRRAGFAPVTSRREVNGGTFHVVGVAPGESANGTILRLKDAGFEAFPVYGTLP